ncbi:uncharacterized protein ACHE_50827A [Aspergillus chevalieri]|uniref:Uncharacterized protein n=1 Tax=Aspergillus chevalieri TaxID=182096 RepID=A0A7R7ZQH6_ASPCH|nr:uncharacterized protein ACHE_50827A [Aspergillus chevalieri]BCR89629.1 hypothetical protein ACHE_50827A [Aspergillus chevalieri]
MGIFISPRWFGFIVFSAHCSYISGGYLSSFFLVIYRVHADDVYMLVFVDRRFLIISFPFIICEEKEAVSFLNISFYLLTLRVVFMFVVFHVLDIKPGRLSDHLSVLF